MTASYFSYWGKASKDGGYHLLAHHCLDVAAVADLWWSKSPPIRRSFVEASGLNENHARAWVLLFIALHDLGKFDVRFQLKSPDTALRLWAGFSNAKAAPYAHGENGYAWLLTESVSEYGLSPRQADAFEGWMKAVAGHHGSLPGDPEVQKPFARPDVLAQDRKARREWFQTIWSMFLQPAGIEDGAVPPTPPPLLAGFCSVCDWIGSNEVDGYFSYREKPAADLFNYFEERKTIAENALKDVGVWRLSMGTGGMNRLFPQYEPRQIQTLVDDWPIEPGMTIIEAPTGSGKTEAALAYAARLLSNNLADSIVFALPTQATANAMLERIEAVAEKLYPEGGNVVLAHGKSQYNPKFLDFRKASEQKTVQGGDEALVQCVKWLSCSRKRVFLGQIGVCTVDQVLLSVLPVRHQFVRAFGIRKSVLIIDEIHAYDRYMYGLLSAVLKGQRAAGGSAVLLSATLPFYQREQLLADWATADPPEINDYPLITHAGLTGPTRIWTLPESERPQLRRVEVDLWRTPAMLPEKDGLKMAIKAARSGAKTAIVCNLVADAQRIFQQLKNECAAEGVALDLFHARYRFMDRQERESAVLKIYGKDGSSGGGRILVATQVIEQSLDLDFDWLISQLCPADLLFQRMGRLHRHTRKGRPAGFEAPRCAVLLPDTEDYGLHAVIYGNERALWRTEKMLRTSTPVVFPGAYRHWIEAVYDEEPWADEPEEITEQFDTFLAEQEGKRYSALQRAHAEAVPLNDTDGNAALLTRDGEMNLNIVPIIEREGKRFTLEGESIFDPEDWRHAEQLNRNIVTAPRGWRNRLPPADEKGLHYLPVRPIGETHWEYKGADVLFRYTIEIGFEDLSP